MAVVGWVCMVLGILFLIVGLIGAAKELWMKPATAGEAIPTWLGTLLEILKQGGWTASAALGIVLLLIGLGLTAPDVFSDDSKNKTSGAAMSIMG